MGNYKEESDNESDIDEPEELQENSDDDWAAGSGKRGSTRAKRGPYKKKKVNGAGNDEDIPKSKRGRPSATKSKTPAKGKATEKSEKDKKKLDESIEEEEEEEEEYLEEEGEEEEEDEDDNVTVPKEFSSGAFIVRKTDYNSMDDPPLWKIDGKALLQKYVPETKDGKTLYKNTSSYSGWNINNKDQFLPATVAFKHQTKKDHIIEFQTELMPKKERSAK